MGLIERVCRRSGILRGGYAFSSASTSTSRVGWSMSPLAVKGRDICIGDRVFFLRGAGTRSFIDSRKLGEGDLLIDDIASALEGGDKLMLYELKAIFTIRAEENGACLL